MLVLILAPASVMAAGQQGQAQSIGKEAGSCLNAQHEIAIETTAQENVRNGDKLGSGMASQNDDAQMLRNRTSDQACDQDKTMAQNMTRDQVRLGSDSGSLGENRGAGLNGDTGSENQQQGGAGDQNQSQFGLTRGNGQNILTGFADQLGFQFRNIGGIFHTLLPQSDAKPLTTP